MKLTCKIMTIVALCAGLTQVVRPDLQPTRAYKSNPKDWKDLWGVRIFDESGMPVSIIPEFRRNTDNLRDKLGFRFGSKGSKNIIQVYKEPLEKVINLAIVPLTLTVTQSDVPEGSQIKITGTKIEIDTSKVKKAQSIGNSITITNKLVKEFPITVSFADSKEAKPSKPFKKRIKNNQKIVIQQPQDKNFVVIALYDDAHYKKIISQGAFNLSNPMFDNKRDITIDGVSSDPRLYINNLELRQ